MFFEQCVKLQEESNNDLEYLVEMFRQQSPSIPLTVVDSRTENPSNHCAADQSYFHLQKLLIHPTDQTSFDSLVHSLDPPLSLQKDYSQQSSTPVPIIQNSSFTLNEHSDDNESWSGNDSSKNKPKKKAINKKLKADQPKKGYPTNNIMPAFRRILTDYLEQFFVPAVFIKIPIIKKIKSKPEITLEDFEELLNEKQFRLHLKVYFKKKTIYRDLMLSRVKQQQRMVYLRRIHIFERGFKTGRFDSINY